MTPDLDHRRRIADADPQDKAARLAHAHELARAGRGDELIAPLATLASWSSLYPDHQDLVIAEVARRLDDRWECLGAREWSCPVNGKPHAQRLGFFRQNELGAEMCLVPGRKSMGCEDCGGGGGTYVHASDCDDDLCTGAGYGIYDCYGEWEECGSPECQVIAPLLVGRMPVTTCQAHGCIDGAQPPLHRCGMPLTGYSHEEAELLLATCDMRLPTMAEWKWAASGGVETLFPWGDQLDLGYVWCLESTRGLGMSVVSPGMAPANRHDKQGKRSAFGLVDLHGNTWERCQERSEQHNGPCGLVFGGDYATGRSDFDFDGVAHDGLWIPDNGESLEGVGLRAFADIPGWRSP